MESREIIKRLQKQLANTGDIKAYCPVITPRTMKLFKTQPNIEFETNPQQKPHRDVTYTHDRPGLVSAVAQYFWPVTFS